MTPEEGSTSEMKSAELEACSGNVKDSRPDQEIVVVGARVGGGAKVVLYVQLDKRRACTSCSGDSSSPLMVPTLLGPCLESEKNPSLTLGRRA